MLAILKKSRFFLIFVIIMNTSSLLASELTNISVVQDQFQSSFKNNGNIIKQLFNEDGLLVYDSVIRLIEEIEKGYLDDICTDKDWEQISYFLASLAKLGVMPDDTDQDNIKLEKDIQKLLNTFKSNNSFKNTNYSTDNYQIVSAVYYGQTDFIFCKNWFIKKCNQVGHFVENHKKAIIIGTVVAVAVTGAIVGAISVYSAATAAAVTTSAATMDLSESNDKSISNNESVFSNNHTTQQIDNPSRNIAVEPLPENFEYQILNEINENKNVLATPLEQNLYQGNERYLGSILAHEALQNMPNNLNLPYDKKDYEEILAQGHGKIDNAFSTNQSSLYLDNNNMFKTPEQSFQENYYYLQGQQALKESYYDRAIDNFSNALASNPNNHDIYLDRAYAYLQNGQFDQSLNDYRVFSEQKNNDIKPKMTFIDCVDFTTAMTAGITKGAVESGRQLISFATNTITHPVQAYSSFVESIQMISDLAKDNEWKTLSQIVFPEVCELVNNWDNFTPKEKGEKSGYIIGKYGADILVPGAATKAVAQGIKGAKELIVVAKNLEKTEKFIVLEALAETGNSGTFKEIVYSNRVFESAGSTGKLIEGYSIEKLAEAGKVFDREGLTKAGRALSKHGGRECTVFPKPIGNPTQINQQGQAILENILNDSKTIYKNRFGGIDIYNSKGQGVRFNKENELMGFLQPKE